jgi:hypothetical protein
MLLKLFIFSLIFSTVLAIPWPFVVNQDSAIGKIYSIDANTSAPADGASVNLTFYIQPLKSDFVFNPAIDGHSNVTALGNNGKWGPEYKSTQPCKIGTVCSVWCVYKSGNIIANYTATINITHAFYRSTTDAMSVFVRLPANKRLTAD